MASYRGHVGLAFGRGRQQIFETVRGHWAASLGLEPDDGSYFLELDSGTCSFRELGEALAIHGQSVDGVASTMSRLLDGGFVQRHAARTQRDSPTIETATRELESALLGYRDLRPSRRPPEIAVKAKVHAKEIMNPTLCAAFFRVVAARLLLAKLSDASYS